MTREKKYHEAMVTVSCSIGNWCSEDIQKYVTSLEQRIQELESPKTCEGCGYYYGNPIVNGEFICDSCDRQLRNDYYEPKDNG